jgi:hypothetical protein
MVGKPEGKRPLERHRHKWQYNNNNNNKNNIFHLPLIHYRVKDQLDVEVVQIH